MQCYIVTFDPVGSGAADAIKEVLKSYGYYCPITTTSWAIVTGGSAVEIRDRLAQASPESKVFVLRSGTEGAWRFLPQANTDWLKKYL
jgi:hypothetical protein